MRSLTTLILSTCSALVLSACGGSDKDDAPATPVAINSVTVIGDSLSDIGATGIRYTVQAAQGEPYPLWTDIIRSQTQAPAACSYYLLSSPTTFNQISGCTNYAVAGSRIHASLPASPFHILTQMQQARAITGSEGFDAGQLLLLDGGGNDAADLIEAYLALLLSAQGTGTPDPSAYAAFLTPVLGSSAVQAWLQSGPQGAEHAAQAYMQALAQQFSHAIRQELLDAGAPRIAILNIPDITLTPRFQPMLQWLAAMPGGSPALAQQMQTLFQTWVRAFNQELAMAFEHTDEVVIIDAFGQLGRWAEAGADFGFTDTRHAICPAVDPAALIPDYDIAQCTDRYLDAHAPASQGSGWWQSYAFADGFHPSPLGHRVMAQAAADVIRAKGWY
ncbi:SGNH/GDSL hydrolase family protein [Kerstersia sp.]|uniref:SGNH/GDSL hydrolase family protein n=1 Tax=Kerstersia sp. TaxID=1930783 RepID=UPI003F8E2882